MSARYADRVPESWQPRRPREAPILKPLGQVLKAVLRRDGVPTEARLAEVHRAWREVVPAPFERLTRVAGLRGRVVRVEVSSAAVRQELVQFHAEALRRALVRALGGRHIEKIAFVLNDRRSPHGED